MKDLTETVSMEEWCAFSYKACHLADPEARLQLARLYKRCAHIEGNLRYALFWLGMAKEAYLKQDRTDFIFWRELSEEVSGVAAALSDREVEYIRRHVEWAARYSVGLSDQSAPSDEEVEKFCDDMSQ